jgi:hypothetical protein
LDLLPAQPAVDKVNDASVSDLIGPAEILAFVAVHNDAPGRSSQEVFVRCSMRFRHFGFDMRNA